MKHETPEFLFTSAYLVSRIIGSNQPSRLSEKRFGEITTTDFKPIVTNNYAEQLEAKLKKAYVGSHMYLLFNNKPVLIAVRHYDGWEMIKAKGR